MRRGRPRGLVKLLDNDRRFEYAAWWAFVALGMKPYPAAYLVAFLASPKAITIESVGGVLLKCSTGLTARTVTGHAYRIRSDADKAMARARECPAGDDYEWLTNSIALIGALLKYAIKDDAAGFAMTRELMKEAGWEDTLALLGRRLGKSLQSKLPPASEPLGRAAARLFHKLEEGGVGFPKSSDLFVDGTLDTPPLPRNS